MDHDSIPRVRFNCFRWSRHYALEGNIGIEIGECNMLCKRCFTACGSAPYRAQLPLLSAPEIWERMLAWRAAHRNAAKTTLLRFGGGEWLQSERSARVLFELMRMAADRRYWLLLETNCTAVDAWRLAELRSIAARDEVFWPDCGIFASLKGIDVASFTAHARVSGSLFQRSLDGIRALDSLGIFGILAFCTTGCTKAQAQPFMDALAGDLRNFEIYWKPVKAHGFTGTDLKLDVSTLGRVREFVSLNRELGDIRSVEAVPGKK